RQHPIGTYIVDFVCFECRLVVEVDGSQHREAARYDSIRDRDLEARGFLVLRFWNNDVLAATDAVLEEIQAVAVRRSPSPPSSSRIEAPPQRLTPELPSPAKRERGGGEGRSRHRVLNARSEGS
ncbi:MAG TPA: DUF559 domain-containing protein, partial [Burkholderiaceae bacterium]|nr:DUF559 domain-containing protein [Burkholderiaceae bacterium]